jgi:hypothetical protein
MDKELKIKEEEPCCNTAREMSLHEQLSELATRHSRNAQYEEQLSQGYRTLLEMLPVGLSEKQQRDIRNVTIALRQLSHV